MAIKKVKLPNNTTVDINDARNVVIGDGADNIVTLTNAEYQALATKDPNTVYIVTDVDPGGGGGGGGNGTVTSVAMTVPTGLSVSGSPITTSGTLAVSLASGYSIPTTTKQSEWDGKADKVSSATNGDFAGLDSNGNLTDSGKKDSDFVHTSGNETIAGTKIFSNDSYWADEAIIHFGTDGGIQNNDDTGFYWISDANGDSLQDALNAKQATLVSGTNIKTVNSQSLLGSGNIDAKDILVVDYGSDQVWQDIVTAYSNGKAVYCKIDESPDVYLIPLIYLDTSDSALFISPIQANGYFIWAVVSMGDSWNQGSFTLQPTLVSGTNIKTINNNSLLGSGDVSVGTITGITMNGASKGTSGVVDLGTVITSHQDISGKADDSAVVHKTGNEQIAGSKTFSAKTTFGAGIEAEGIDISGGASVHSTDDGDFSWISAYNNTTLQDALDAKQKAITVSTSEPTSSQGSNGDIWIVI